MSTHKIHFCREIRKNNTQKPLLSGVMVTVNVLFLYVGNPNDPVISTIPASILRKSTLGRHRPVSYPDGPMTARYRFT